jgi:hypothetical protein
VTRAVPAALALGLALAAGASADDGVRISGRTTHDPQQAAVTAHNLQVAVTTADLELLRVLLAKGADPNERTTDMGTGGTLELALSFHCIGSRTDAETRDAIFGALFDGGADPNVMGIGNVPVFVFVAQQCPPSVVRLFAQAGARLDLRSPQGFTPLSMALVTGNLDAAEALLDLGARLSAEARRKLYPTPPDDPRLAALVKRASSPAPPKPSRRQTRPVPRRVVRVDAPGSFAALGSD